MKRLAIRSAFVLAASLVAAAVVAPPAHAQGRCTDCIRCGGHYFGCVTAVPTGDNCDGMGCEECERERDICGYAHFELQQHLQTQAKLALLLGPDRDETDRSVPPGS